MTWAPVLLAMFSLYFALAAYFGELAAFVETPSAQSAGIILALLGGGFLVWLFFWAVATVAVVELASGAQGRTEAHVQLQIGRPEWRLYAGLLRILLVAVVFFAVAVGLWSLVTGKTLVDILWPNGAEFVTLAGNFAIAMCIVFLFVRLGVLAPAIAALEAGAIVRRAWRLSAGNSARLLVLLVVLLLPGFALQLAGEQAFRLGAFLPEMPRGAVIAAYVSIMREALPALLIVTTLAQWISVVLIAAASVSAYKALTASAPAA